MSNESREALSPSDLNWWYGDHPRQPTTMAMLMLLDRRPQWQRLQSTVRYAVESVPRLHQRIVDAPFDLALPRWEIDPTFDLSYHLRHYSLSEPTGAGGALEELFRVIGPIYERPFDTTRPLWELIEIDRPPEGSALFFRLHHSIADGVGANAILAALTDATREGDPRPPTDEKPPGTWPAEAAFGERLVGALRDRLDDDVGRVRQTAGILRGMIRAPGRLLDVGRAVGSVSRELARRGKPTLERYGRARRLGGVAIPFDSLRDARKRLDCRTIDVLLTGVAGAVGEWYRRTGRDDTKGLLTAVPINLRPREEQGLASELGNDLTALLLRLPIGEHDPRRRLEVVRDLVARKSRHPSAGIFPMFAGALARLPRPLHRLASLAGTGMIDLVVTNVPGVPVPRFVAGAEIEAAYPFAPVMPHCPLSIALYGYRDRLYIGLDADATAVSELDSISELLAKAMSELAELEPGPG